MGSSDLTLTRTTTRTTIKMSVSTIISCFLFSSQFLSTFASVAVGYAKLNPDNPNECVDPDNVLDTVLEPVGVFLDVARPDVTSDMELSIFHIHIAVQFTQKMVLSEEGCPDALPILLSQIILSH